MKPTSIIFLILAAILIVAGIILCIIGGAMAGDDMEILCDYTDEEGNDITKESLEKYSITSIDINLENVNVNIIGQNTESYIEFKNINFAKYDFSINKKKLSLESISPFDVSSIIKIRENEGGFDGLRYYLHLNEYKDDLSEVNIYLMPGQFIENINITLKNGDITIENMGNDPSYDLKTNTGNIVFKSTKTGGKVKVETNDGNFTFDRSNAFSIDLNINKGHGKFLADRQFNYTLECEFGNIIIDDNNTGETAPGVYPENIASSGEPDGEEVVIVPCSVNGKITSGDLVIDTVEPDPDETPETEETEESTETAEAAA